MCSPHLQPPTHTQSYKLVYLKRQIPRAIIFRQTYNGPICVHHIYNLTTHKQSYKLDNYISKDTFQGQYFWQTYKSTLKIDSKGHYFWQTYNGPICVHNIYILQTNQPPYLQSFTIWIYNPEKKITGLSFTIWALPFS